MHVNTYFSSIKRGPLFGALLWQRDSALHIPTPWLGEKIPTILPLWKDVPKLLGDEYCSWSIPRGQDLW